MFRPVHCTFDLPLCGLVNDWTSSGDKWTERTGPVSGRGPQTDHSNGAGEENTSLVSLSSGNYIILIFYCHHVHIAYLLIFLIKLR